MEDWTHKHLLGLEELSASEIIRVLDLAEELRKRVAQPSPAVAASGATGTAEGGCATSDLRGKAVVNLFFEPSTRTRTSFELAERRLGATVINFDVATSSVVKDETLRDTARNIEAMGIDAVVMRHGCAGAPALLARSIQASIINAGDGQHEHPTQGLLDILTIRQHLGRIAGLKVAIVGDIAHSRVARSNFWGLTKLGAEVWFVGPTTLVPGAFAKLGARLSHDLDAVLPEMDVMNMLRVQTERLEEQPFPSVREYSRLFGLTAERLRRAKPNVLVMHPGPINRGVEMSPEVADGPRSAILEQVANGVAVRMAVLALVTRNQ